jgi:hypothetical protein
LNRGVWTSDVGATSSKGFASFGMEFSGFGALCETPSACSRMDFNLARRASGSSITNLCAQERTAKDALKLCENRALKTRLENYVLNLYNLRPECKRLIKVLQVFDHKPLPCSKSKDS